MGAIRNLNLKTWIDKHNPSVFVETGAGYGTGIFTILPYYNFGAILSVEIDREQTDLLNKFFRFDTRVKVFNMLSRDFLNSIIPQISSDTPIFFFLDSHFPQADFGLKEFDDEKDENIRMPLWEEVNIIKRLRPISKDLILIDDISLFDDSNFKYDDDHKLKSIAHKLLPKLHRNYLHKIINLFDDTHNSEVMKNEQGYLILTPKNS
jgi:hypothetical protein